MMTVKTKICILGGGAGGTGCAYTQLQSKTQ